MTPYVPGSNRFESLTYLGQLLQSRPTAHKGIAAKNPSPGFSAVTPYAPGSNRFKSLAYLGQLLQSRPAYIPNTNRLASLTTNFFTNSPPFRMIKLKF